MAEELTRDQWLARRRKYIGGSDAAAALGMSPYTTRLELCRDKWVERADVPSAVMERGTLLEDVVAELYRRQSGHDTEPGAWCVSSEYPWMAASPDLLDKTGDCIVQIKTSSSWARHQWGSAESPHVPDHYAIQCQHEMAVTGCTANVLVVLFSDESAFRGMAAMRKGGFRPTAIADHVQELQADAMAEMLTIRIDRDDDMISDIVKGEREFWETFVVPHVCPPDASIPQQHSDVLDATDEQTETLRRLADAKRIENAAQEQYACERAKVETYIGDHSGIVAPGVAKVSWKAKPAEKSVDWRAVATTLAQWAGKAPPQIETWESLAKQLGLEAGDDLYNTAVELHTESVQPPRVFRPTFPRT